MNGRALLLCLLVLSPAATLYARDIPEPIEAVDPLAGIDDSSPAILPSSFMMLRYENYTFEKSDTDSFQISATGAFGLFNLGGIVAGKVFYCTHLLVGPLLPGDVAASAAKWWMNFIQFQYGLTAGASLGGFHVFGEYSRASAHPLRAELTASQDFENPAFERIFAGVVLPPIDLGEISIETHLRGGYVDLFNYWKAYDIPEPRTRWLLRLGLRAETRISSSTGLYLDFSPELLLLRTDKAAYNYRTEAGFAVRSGGRVLSLFACFIGIDDAEELVGRRYSVRLAGLGFSLRS